MRGSGNLGYIPPPSSGGGGGDPGDSGDVFLAASQAAMLALVATKGDMAKRTDTGEVYRLTGADPTLLANWVVIGNDCRINVSGLTVTVSAFTAGPFYFAGGTLSVVANGTWYVGVDLYRNTLIALPRLGHRGWVPVGKVVAGASAVTSVEQITPVLPASRLPRAMAKILAGQALNVVVMGSSLAEGADTSTATWAGMLFYSGSEVAKYRLPAASLTFRNVALGGTPNLYQLAQLGNGGRNNSAGAISDSGFTEKFVNRVPPTGRSAFFNGVDLVVLTCLANGGDYRMDIIEPVVRRLRERDIEVVLLTDNPQGPTLSYATMATALLYTDGPSVMRVADLYECELADTAAYVFSDHLRYGSGIYSDSIHMLSAVPAGPATAQPSGGHETYARALRSLFNVAQAPNVVVANYDFAGGVDPWTAFNAANGSVAAPSGQMVVEKTTGASGQWGAWVPVPAMLTGDTVRVQGTLTFGAGWSGGTFATVGMQGGGAGWGSSQANINAGAFDVTITLTRDITSGGRLLLFSQNDAVAAGNQIIYDNVTITTTTAIQAATDSLPGRAAVPQALPASRIVTDLKTPGDVFVILPRDERYVVTSNANKGTIGSHPLGTNSFARRFDPSTGASEGLLTLTTGQRAVVGAIGAVGFSLIHYGLTTDTTTTFEVWRNGALDRTINIGAGNNRDAVVTFLTPTAFANTAVLNNQVVELRVTAGELRVAAFLGLTADVTYIRRDDIRFVGSWAEESTFFPGKYTDTPNDYAEVVSPSRRLYWVAANRSNSQPCDLYSDRDLIAGQSMSGTNHVRVIGPTNGRGVYHTIKLNSAAGAPVAGNRSLHIIGAVGVNDR